MQRVFEFIARFTDLTEAERQVVLQSNTVKRVRKNEILPQQINGQALGYFVLSGCICAYQLHQNEATVADFFLDGDPVVLPTVEAFELRCIEDTEVAVSLSAETERLVAQMPRFENVCRKFAEEKMAFMTRFNMQLKGLAPDDRYRFLLAERPELFGRVPQYLLASYLGVTPETISRIRRRFLD